MNGYERRTAQKKEKIRTAALALFRTHGPDKISINEIAEKAGVAPASIYNYFGSKEGLIKEAVIHLLESDWKARKELWESDLPFPELLERAVSSKDAFIEQTSVELARAMFTDPEIQRLFDEFYTLHYPAIVSKFLEKGRREGYIRKDISIEAAMVYLKMVQHAVRQPEMIEEKNRDLYKELFDLLLYGLAGQPIQNRAKN